MNSNEPGFTTDVSEVNKIKFAGLMRLRSPENYDIFLEESKRVMGSSDGDFEIDLKGVSICNSSGVMSLSRLMIYSKPDKGILYVRIDAESHWQKKLSASLKRLKKEIVVVSD